jgi:hypothetical protein
MQIATWNNKLNRRRLKGMGYEGRRSNDREA